MRTLEFLAVILILSAITAGQRAEQNQQRQRAAAQAAGVGGRARTRAHHRHAQRKRMIGDIQTLPISIIAVDDANEEQKQCKDVTDVDAASVPNVNTQLQVLVSEPQSLDQPQPIDASSASPEQVEMTVRPSRSHRHLADVFSQQSSNPLPPSSSAKSSPSSPPRVQGQASVMLSRSPSVRATAIATTFTTTTTAPGTPAAESLRSPPPTEPAPLSPNDSPSSKPPQIHIQDDDDLDFVSVSHSEGVSQVRLHPNVTSSVSRPIPSSSHSFFDLALAPSPKHQHDYSPSSDLFNLPNRFDRAVAAATATAFSSPASVPPAHATATVSSARGHMTLPSPNMHARHPTQSIHSGAQTLNSGIVSMSARSNSPVSHSHAYIQQTVHPPSSALSTSRPSSPAHTSRRLIIVDAHDHDHDEVEELDLDEETDLNPSNISQFYDDDESVDLQPSAQGQQRHSHSAAQQNNRAPKKHSASGSASFISFSNTHHAVVLPLSHDETDSPQPSDPNHTITVTQNTAISNSDGLQRQASHSSVVTLH